MNQKIWTQKINLLFRPLPLFLSLLFGGLFVGTLLCFGLVALADAPSQQAQTAELQPDTATVCSPSESPPLLSMTQQLGQNLQSIFNSILGFNVKQFAQKIKISLSPPTQTLKNFSITQDQNRGVTILTHGNTALDLTSLFNKALRSNTEIEVLVHEDGSLTIQDPGAFKARIQIDPSIQDNLVSIDAQGQLKIGSHKVLQIQKNAQNRKTPELQVHLKTAFKPKLGRTEVFEIRKDGHTLQIHDVKRAHLSLQEKKIRIHLPQVMPQIQNLEFSKPSSHYEFYPTSLLKKRFVFQKNDLDLEAAGIQGEIFLNGGKITLSKTREGTPFAATVGTDDAIRVLMTHKEIQPQIFENYFTRKKYEETHGELFQWVLAQVEKINHTQSTTEKIQIAHSIFTTVRSHLNADIAASKHNATEQDQLTIEEAAAIGIFLTDNLILKEISKILPEFINSKIAVDLLGRGAGVLSGVGGAVVEKGDVILKDMSKIAALSANPMLTNQFLISALKKIQNFKLSLITEKEPENIALIHFRGSERSPHESPAGILTRSQEGAEIFTAFQVGKEQQQAKSSHFADVRFMAMPVLGSHGKRFKLIRPQVSVTEKQGSFVGLGELVVSTEPSQKPYYSQGQITSQTTPEGHVIPVLEGGDGSLKIGEDILIHPHPEAQSKKISIAVVQGNTLVEVQKGILERDPSGKTIEHTKLHLKLDGQLISNGLAVSLLNPVFTLKKEGIVNIQNQHLRGTVRIQELDLPNNALRFIVEGIQNEKRQNASLSPVDLTAEPVSLNFRLKNYAISAGMSFQEDSDLISVKIQSWNTMITPQNIRYEDGNMPEIPLQQFLYEMQIDDRRGHAECVGRLGLTTAGTERDRPLWLQKTDEAQALKDFGKFPLLGFTPQGVPAHRVEGRFIFHEPSPSNTSLPAIQINGHLAGVKETAPLQSLEDPASYRTPPTSPQTPIWIAGRANFDLRGKFQTREMRVAFHEVPGTQQNKTAILSGELPLRTEIPDPMGSPILIELDKTDKKTAKIKVTTPDGKQLSETAVSELKLPTSLEHFLAYVKKGKLTAKTVFSEQGLTVAAALEPLERAHGKLVGIEGTLNLQYDFKSEKEWIELNAPHIQLKGVTEPDKIQAIGSGEFLYIGKKSDGTPWFLQAQFNQIGIQQTGRAAQFLLRLPGNPEEAKKAGLILTLGQFSSEKKNLTLEEVKKQISENLFVENKVKETPTVSVLQKLGIEYFSHLHNPENFEALLALPNDETGQEGVLVEAPQLPAQGKIQLPSHDPQEDSSQLEVKLQSNHFRLNTSQSAVTWSGLQGAIAKAGDFLVRIQTSSQAGKIDWDEKSLQTSQNAQIEYLWKNPDQPGYLKYRFYPDGEFSIESVEKLINSLNGLTEKRKAELETQKQSLIQKWRNLNIPGHSVKLSGSLSGLNEELLRESGQIDQTRERLLALRIFLEKNLPDAAELKKQIPEGLKILEELEEVARLQENNFRSLLAANTNSQNHGSIRFEANPKEQITFYLRPGETLVQVQNVILRPDPQTTNDLTEEEKNLLATSLSVQVVASPPPHQNPTKPKEEPIQILKRSGLIQHRTLNALLGISHTLTDIRDYEGALAEILFWAEAKTQASHAQQARVQAQSEAHQIIASLVMGEAYLADHSNQESREHRNQRLSQPNPLEARLQKALSTYQEQQKKDKSLIPIPDDFLNSLAKRCLRLKEYYFLHLPN